MTKKKKMLLGLVLLSVSPLFWWPMTMRQYNQIFASAMQTDKEIFVLVDQKHSNWRGSPFSFFVQVMILGYSPSYLVDSYTLWHITSQGKTKFTFPNRRIASIFFRDGNVYLLDILGKEPGGGFLVWNGEKFQSVSGGKSTELTLALKQNENMLSHVPKGWLQVSNSDVLTTAKHSSFIPLFIGKEAFKLRMSTGGTQEVRLSKVSQPYSSVLSVTQDNDFHFISAAEYRQAVAESWRFG